MAAIVCHGLQSCLESQLVESRALTLSFPFSKPNTPPPQSPIDLPIKKNSWDSTAKTQERHDNKTDTTTGWSFLQALSNVSYVSKESSTDKESVYVHPQAKRSSTSMSQKSLELCTEKLGNETGSDIVENNGHQMDLLCSSPTTRKQAIPRQGCLGERKTRTQNFPPPLTTMRGSESLQLRTHREDGRLVVQAIRVPPSPSCFQAERSHGRLRLWFLKNHSKVDPEEMQASNDDEGVEEERESESADSERTKQEEDEDKEEEETEEEEEGTRKEYERPRRCKEGDEQENIDLLNNWGEPLWVAIS
ncbi:protein FANTASTIC FOUR 3-like [Prosopis cineraria]|uniref:protein FANTASTIC FOUR 3-like n=1 Tax=Prosopis cineraria TaxID=364024 RepID=UPI00240FC1AB|nr:protein FANTASTIC FOUR 3-like [Prosopis cineraria]